jgi:hypothetical protein
MSQQVDNDRKRGFLKRRRAGEPRISKQKEILQYVIVILVILLIVWLALLVT